MEGNEGHSVKQEPSNNLDNTCKSRITLNGYIHEWAKMGLGSIFQGLAHAHGDGLFIV